MPSIIVKAMLIARNGEKLLFSRGCDAKKKQAFLRPLGGHVEFGESGAKTIGREIHEELGCDVLKLRFLSMVENSFTYNGTAQHEIVLMYDGKLADESLQNKDSFTFMEGNCKTEAGWFSKADVEKEGIPIYPPFEYFNQKHERARNENAKQT